MIKTELLRLYEFASKLHTITQIGAGKVGCPCEIPVLYSYIKTQAKQTSRHCTLVLRRFDISCKKVFSGRRQMDRKIYSILFGTGECLHVHQFPCPDIIQPVDGALVPALPVEFTMFEVNIDGKYTRLETVTMLYNKK